MPPPFGPPPSGTADTTLTSFTLVVTPASLDVADSLDGEHLLEQITATVVDGLGANAVSVTSVHVTLSQTVQLDVAALPAGVTAAQMAAGLKATLCPTDASPRPPCAVVIGESGTARRSRSLSAVTFVMRRGVDGVANASLAAPPVNTSALARTLGLVTNDFGPISSRVTAIEASVAVISSRGSLSSLTAASWAQHSLPAALATSLGLDASTFTLASDPITIVPPARPSQPRTDLSYLSYSYLGNVSDVDNASSYAYSYEDGVQPSTPPSPPPLTPVQGILRDISTPCTAASRLEDGDFLVWDPMRLALVDGAGRALPPFASINIPNLHRIELPADACASGSECARAPTDAEMVDALCSVRHTAAAACRCLPSPCPLVTRSQYTP